MLGGIYPGIVLGHMVTVSHFEELSGCWAQQLRYFTFPSATTVPIAPTFLVFTIASLMLAKRYRIVVFIYISPSGYFKKNMVNIFLEVICLTTLTL